MGTEVLIEVEGGWVWADNDLARKAKDEFEAAIFTLDAETTSDVLSRMMVQAIASGIEGEESQSFMVKVVVGAIEKIQRDARDAWRLVHEATGCVSVTYDWPSGMFSPMAVEGADDQK